MVKTPSETKTPVQAVEDRLIDLTAAIDALPFAGRDQRLRAEDLLSRLRRQLSTLQLLEGQ